MKNIENMLSKRESTIITEDNFVAKFPKFFENIGSEIKNVDGSVSFENGEVKVTLDSQDFEEYLDSCEDGEVLKGVITDSDQSFDPRDYVRLNKFIIEDGSNSLILDYKNEYRTVIYKKRDDSAPSRSEAFHDIDLVRLHRQPSSPDGILVLLHEIGHLEDPELSEGVQRQSTLKFEAIIAGGYTKEIKEENDAITLKSERKAWAYALNKIRFIIRKLGIPEESVKDFIHGYTLGSYCKTMHH